jgi:serine/threonine protein kinase
MTTPVPTKIGKYDVIGVIGRGGMGVVYQGRDPQLDRMVAIKMIVGGFAEHPDMLKRFFREAQSLGSLQHPNIVTVFDLGDYGGNPYLVMEYLEGEGLDRVLSNHRQLSLLEKLTIVIQVCHGLNYAHRRGVIHRDIKPANIMLSKDGGIKIFDFGIAHAGDQSVTRTGQVMGTLKYMAPEQFNSRSPDFRTDIFSTGVVLYQLFTDHLPFEAENTATTMLKIVHEPPPPLGTFLSSYPPEMEQILLRALAKNPDDRYRSAEEFAMDLEQLQGQLKEELIGREMHEVALFLERGEVVKAQSSLARVLKVDQQHSTANRLLRELQQRIQREEIGKQVRELRQHAEDSMADEHFEKALEHVDRALGLDRNNADLRQLRDAICAAISRAEKLHNALKKAEEAQAEGRLDEAREAAEEALAVAPKDTQARTLFRLISRDIEERSRQREIEGYLSEARQQISSRRFTAALEILKRAEELDPAAPQVHSLIDSATAGQEQERRRKELEVLIREVDDALNRDDYRSACRKADQGLARFPEDRNLLKLKALADRQRQIEERRQFVDEQLGAARQLLQAGRNEELQQMLENAIAQTGAEPRLQSLLAVVSENLQHERMERLKTEGLRGAQQSLDNQAFEDAIQTLEGLAREIGDDVDSGAMLARARSEQSDAVERALQCAEQEAVLAVRLNIIEEAMHKSPRDERLKKQLQHVRNLNEVISKIACEAQKMEEARQFDRALAKWETIGTVYPQYPDLKHTIKRVRELRDRAHTAARQDWIDRIENALSRGEYAEAQALAGPANQEFPVDSDLMELEEKAEAAVRQRGKAQKMLAEGRQSFANRQWEAGAQILLRAYQLASQDSVIREHAVGELVRASRETIETDWRASEVILRNLAEIQPGAASSPDLQVAIQERRRKEAIAGAMEGATRRQASGDLQGALCELAQALVWYPEDRGLRETETFLKARIEQAQQASRLEEARREKDAYVQEVINRARQAVDLDQRVQVLEEALGRDPNETRLQQPLIAARELQTRVASLVSDAHNLEQSRQYGQALAKWETVAATYGNYPEIDHILDQARQRHQRARLEAKANHISILQLALSSAEYKRAEDLLAQAKRDFPGDRELAEMEKRVREGIANRAQAEKILAGAAKAVDKEKWKKAVESFREANAVAPSDLVIRDQAVRGLLLAAHAALLSDCESSEMLLSEATRVEPGSPLLEPVRTRIEERKHALHTEQCLNAAQRCRSTGDRQGALRSLDRGLAAYPNEPRLMEARSRIEGEIGKREEELRARELGEKEAREKELRDRTQRQEEQRRVGEQEQRERELRQERQRAQARELEQSRQEPASPIWVEPAGLSATQIFSQRTPQAARDASGQSAFPVTPPGTRSGENHDSPPPVPADVVGTTGANARDATAFDKANFRTRSFEGELTHIQPGVGSDALQEASLQIIERQLAAFIGPLAKILVKRAAGKTSSVVELYTILAASLEQEDDRKAFLGRRTELVEGKASAASSRSAQSAPPTTPLDFSAPGEITPAAIEQAARRLAAHLGPIASVLARKDAKRAATLRNFYEFLSEHLADPKDRERFLKEAGIQ